MSPGSGSNKDDPAAVKYLYAYARFNGRQTMKLRLLYRLKSNTTEVSQFGDTHDGPRADVYLEGEVKGRVNGKFHGVDYGLSRGLKNPGTVVLHVHETIVTDDGPISVMRRGYAVPEGASFHVKATCLFQTASRKFDFLNGTIGVAEGYADGKGVQLSVFEVV